MSELISRAAAIKFIQEEIKQDRSDDFKIRNIKRFIEDMPMAYNVDKVITELEKEKNDSLLSASKQVYPDYRDMDIQEAEAYKNAIDIVKRGGVNIDSRADQGSSQDDA